MIFQLQQWSRVTLNKLSDLYKCYLTDLKDLIVIWFFISEASSIDSCSQEIKNILPSDGTVLPLLEYNIFYKKKKTKILVVYNKT